MNLYKKIVIFNIIALFLSIIVGSWIFFQFYKFINTPSTSQNNGVYVEIDKGENLYSIIKKLKRANIISRSDWFYYYIKVKGAARNIKAGTHFFYTNYTPKDVLNELVSISVYSVKIVVAEGSSLNDIAKILKKSGYEYKKFLTLSRNREFVSKLVGFDAESLEGFLYPDTYYFEKHEKIERIIKVMFNRFMGIYKEIARKNIIEKDDYKKIIIASIIEKETSKKSDMPLIASVIYNRLKKGMPLQMDSTVIYGIESFDGNLKKEDLENRNNEYNTYVYKSLPKTPICNPSRDSLYAAYHPKTTNYLYFVSKNGKDTIFSKTLKEHNRWVRKYQIK